MAKTKLDADGNIALAKGTRTKAEVDQAREARRDQMHEDILAPTHDLKPSRIWKEYPEEWATSTEDERKDLLCGIIFNDYVCVNKRGLQTIAKLFKIKIADITPFLPDMEVADAARSLRITRNQFEFFLLNDHQPNGKFFIGKQGAYQVSEPAHEGVDSVSDRPQRIVFTEERADPESPKRKAMETALDKRIASATQLTLVPKNP